MRVLFCKIHCPFICFCKPSSHLYNPSPLKLENTPHASPPLPPPTPPLPLPSEASRLGEGQSHANSSSGDNGNGNCNGSVSHLKSSLRKPSKPSPESSHVEKKKVQWVDVLGKELAEIKEFESSEEDGDPGYGRLDNRGCICTIL